MKRLLFALSLATLTCAPVSADTGYFIVKGYGYPQNIIAGPYDDYSTCMRVAIVYGYDYHCVVKAY